MPIDGELTPADDSLRGELEAAFGGDDGTSADTGSVDAGDIPSESKQEASDGGEGPDRARTADGKFAPKTETKAKVEPDKAPASIDPNSPSVDPTKASTDPAAQPAVSAPPAGWTAAEKAEWQKLSPVAQAAVSRREAEIARGGQQWSEEKRRYEAALSPIAQLARARGVSAEEGAQRLAAAQQMLDADPAAGLRQIAASYGIDLATLAGQSPADDASAAPRTPDIEAIVRRAMAPMLAPIQQRFQSEEQAKSEQTLNAIQAFAAAPGHEHYAAVEASIALILPQVIEENPSWTAEQKLKEAYDRAVYATPSTRSLVLADQQRKADETRQAEAKERANKARLAGSSVTGNPSGTAASEVEGSLRDVIRAAMTG